MMFRILLLLLTMMPLSSHLQADIWNSFKNVFGNKKSEDPSIRVLLVHDVPKVNLEVVGKYSLYDPFKNSYLSTRFIGKAKQMESVGDGLKWGEAFPGLYQLQIKPEDKNTIAYVDKNEYNGPLYIYDIGGSISIVNQVPIENYIKSILSGYDLKALEPEVIYALAIVARTNAFYLAANPKTNFWAVDAKKTGYQGNPNQSQNFTMAEKAVEDTKNMIISRTGVYEGVATPFAAEFGYISPQTSVKNYAVSRITLDEANNLASAGVHAAQILAKAFPGTTIMLNQ